MNILSPTPGDLADRQTIVQLKISHAAPEGDTGYSPVSNEILEQNTKKAVSRTVMLEKSAIDIQPWMLENEAIQERFKLDWFTKISEGQGDQFDILLNRLRDVNSELWKLEDQARTLRHAPDKHNPIVIQRKADTLDAITTNNESRYAIISQIDALWGINVKEKIYNG